MPSAHRRHRAFGLSFVPALVLAWGGPVLTASAQQGPAAAQDPTTAARDAALAAEAQLLAGIESDELKQLRVAEIAMFGQAHVDAGRLDASIPAALTSDAPALVEHSEEETRDLTWLRGMVLPDLPIRWDDRVVRYLEYFREDPRGRELMRAWWRRSARYDRMIRQKMQEARLPEDLRCVVMAESGFDPGVTSHAGAVGLWQFIRGTGEWMGLERTHWVDQRRDPLRATEAAARYLTMLQRRLGAWELALAAYNMGYGALTRSMRKFNSNDFWLLSRIESGLPFETTVYVSKIMACAVVFRNPERFGLADVEQDVPMDVEVVEVPGGTPLRRLARAADISIDDLLSYNPELRRRRIPPGGSYALRVPKARHEEFARSWSRVQPRHPAHQPYVLRFGESLGTVARRFRTTDDALRSLNELEDGEVIGPGTSILVPAVEPRDDDDDDAGLPVVALPAEAPTSVPGRRRVFYRVSSHDTLPEIAGFFRVSVDELRRWNHLDPSAALPSGLTLQLFVPEAVDLDRAIVLRPEEVRLLVVGSDDFYAFHEAEQGRVRFRYEIEAGDTLTSIARRFGVEPEDLTRINRFSRSTTLRVGDDLVVYAERRRVPARYLDSDSGGSDSAASNSAASDSGASDSGASDSGGPDSGGPDSGGSAESRAADAEAGADAIATDPQADPESTGGRHDADAGDEPADPPSADARETR